MFSVKEMAIEIISIMSGNTSSKDLEVVLNVRSSLTLRSDLNRIEQVLMNLLSNAILRSPRGGKIKLSFAMEPFNLDMVTSISDYESIKNFNPNLN